MSEEKKIKKDNESLLILQARSRLPGKNARVLNRIMTWLDENEKEVKKITIEFI